MIWMDWTVNFAKFIRRGSFENQIPSTVAQFYVRRDKKKSKTISFRFSRCSILIKTFKNVKVRIPVEGHHALRLATVSFVK